MMELVDAWEEPMPDQVRALLRDELRHRGYRIKSLPEPPPSGATIPMPSESEQARKRVEIGALSILAMAVLQVIAAVLIPLTGSTTPAGSIGIPLGLALLFFLLFFWARSHALPALLTALTLYVGLHALAAAFEPSSIFHGIVFKVLIVVGLVVGIRGSLSSSAGREPSIDTGSPTAAELSDEVFGELLRILEAPEEGGDNGIEDLCRRHPEHAELIRAYVASARSANTAPIVSPLPLKRPFERNQP